MTGKSELFRKNPDGSGRRLLRERGEKMGCKYRITTEGCPDMCGMGVK
ncbi:hypothetical protein [Methanoregula sp.]|jgi:hypothetical protein